jgi:hypothetical protein
MKGNVLDVLCLSGSRKQWSVQWNKKQDDSNVLIVNYDRIYWNLYSSLIYTAHLIMHTAKEKKTNNITIQVMVKVTP